jgi:GTPase involved in cell partitioning and DNA repair
MSKKQDEELIRRAMADMSRKNGTINPINSMTQVLNQLNEMVKYIANLEQGLLGLTTEVQAHRYSHQMMYKLIIEKEIMTKEELDKLYETEVAEPMKKYVEDINNKIKEAQPKEEAKEECDSKVILASERFKQNKEEQPN